MERYKAAFESSPIGLLVVDSEGYISLVNSEIERLFGYKETELLGKSVEVLIPERHMYRHPGLRKSFFKNLETRRMGLGQDLYGLTSDGMEIPVEIGLTPVVTDEGTFVISSIVDISDRKSAEAERRALEEQLRQSQKMEALGQLAGGVAHDFNNILHSILGNAEMAKVDTVDRAIFENLNEIISNVQRGKHIVERILAFSHRKNLNLQPLNLKKQSESTISFLKTALPAELDFNLQIEPGLPNIIADATSIDLIMMNLVNNAAQAMQSAGTLDISLESFYARDNFVRMHPELNEGWYVRIMVRDTGAGMDKQTREKAFDPFFTTKGLGMGSGLGLSMVHGLVREHGGSIWIDSEPGEGTTVSCLFPAVEDTETDYTGDDVSFPYGHSERVLCVDDESALQSVNRQILSALNYKPEIFTDPQKALELFRCSPDGFDLAIIDYSMPRMNGLKLAGELLKTRPDLPVVLVSGSVKGIVEEQFKGSGAKKLLRKPFSRLELAHSLYSILNPH